MEWMRGGRGGIRVEKEWRRRDKGRKGVDEEG
jgi:hypothetical protein